MLAKVNSGAVLGVDGILVEVEVDIAYGLPTFSTVGLPEGAVKESKDRVKAAIKNSGYEFPNRKITVNLAPADVKKVGTGYDLPMAIGILAAAEAIKGNTVEDFILVGELSLDGSIRATRGILPIVLAAKKHGFAGIIVPSGNIHEAAVVSGLSVIGLSTLADVVDYLSSAISAPEYVADTKQFLNIDSKYKVDYQEVKGQEHVKRALEIAAAGGHNLMMKGPPGSGKTMLARRLPTILPDLTFEESLETTKIYSVLGLLPEDTSLLTTRPFRSPHHTISDAGLIGGGQNPRPGEVSIAHNGVLFLDELPEFKKNVLEVLRQPLEDGHVTISRASSSLNFPARFILVAAMNPCPCGFYGDERHECICTPLQIQRYESRISGPLIDRIDLYLEVPAVPFKDLAAVKDGERSETIKKRVMQARNIQTERFSNRTDTYCNSQMGSTDIKKHCNLQPATLTLLENAMERLGLSARAYNRILKIARTIADLDSCQDIGHHHIAEAVQYRRLDKNK